MDTILFKTSTITDGNMSFLIGDVAQALQNRKTFLEQNGIDFEKSICMRCDHGERIMIVDAKTDSSYFANTTQAAMPLAEVLVTQEQNIALLLLTADCLPTLLYDPHTSTIALAHFSRQTIAQLLPQKTVGFLREHFGIDPAHLQVSVGPHIHATSYRFPAPVKEVSDTLLPHTFTKENYTHIDLPGALRAQLTATGVAPDLISFSPIDTVTSAHHFSHYASTRARKEEGRLLTYAQLAECNSAS